MSFWFELYHQQFHQHAENKPIVQMLVQSIWARFFEIRVLKYTSENSLDTFVWTILVQKNIK